MKGFYITRVYPGTTAEKAGLKPGDFITAVDGAKLSASDAEYEDELSSLIRQYDIGKTVELTVLRDKAELEVPESTHSFAERANKSGSGRGAPTGGVRLRAGGFHRPGERHQQGNLRHRPGSTRTMESSGDGLRAADTAVRGVSKLKGIRAAIDGLIRSSAAMAGPSRPSTRRPANIDKVITTITKVANRTNLLSLNAAIEAEKAGEKAGGFSVVALEMRRLADQTAVAALDIERQISRDAAGRPRGVLKRPVLRSADASQFYAVTELSPGWEVHRGTTKLGPSSRP